jgi:predicted RND superfamily exporter protein
VSIERKDLVSTAPEHNRFAAVDRGLARLAALQARRPWLPILACVVLAIIGGALATRLELRTRFDQLLPDHQPSVVELRRVMARTDATSNVFVVLEGDDTAALRAFGDALVPKLRAIGAPWVSAAEDGVQVPRAFLEPRAGLFVELPELEKLRDDIQKRWDWEVGKETGSNIDDSEEPPKVSVDEIKKRFGAADKDDERYPGGYYQAKDGRALVVIAHTAIPGGELGRSAEALARIRAVIDAERAAHAGVKVGYAGDLVTGLAEYGAVKDDLVSVGVLGVGLVLGVILLFFMRVRALVAMGATIGCGLAWTFGLTQLAIGHLNVATGFLFSIVAGNGINFGIIYLARFFEERRRGVAPDAAIATAHATTWPSTLTAAVAAAASYGSLGVTDFRAFKHFAFIGAVGMIVCWIATYAMLPAILLVIERVRPFRGDESTLFGRLRLGGIRYDVPFAWLAPRAPRLFVAAGVLVAIAGAAVATRYVRSDPMEYDMRRLQNDMGGGQEMYRVSGIAAGVLGAKLESAMVILCDRFDQVAPLKKQLDARRDAAPPDAKPFEAVHTLLAFLPSDQEAKLPVLAEIREKLLRAREKGSIADADWPDIERTMPPEDLRAYDVADLPDELARPFTEKDGERGRVVLIEPTAGKNDSDLHYLLRWADSFRETELPNGDVVRGSGRAVIFADMLKAVVLDMPRAIALSLAMTVLAVVVIFRRGKSSLTVLAALGVGLGWVAAYMAISNVRINFFNFIALPITFGIGVDYAVNFVQRYDAARAEGGGILGVLRTTGGAVILCSLTTILGYLALLGSVNQAIRSLGGLAVVGEICCLLAAVLVLPAALFLRERARAQAAASLSGNPNSAVAPASPISTTRSQ